MNLKEQRYSCCAASKEDPVWLFINIWKVFFRKCLTAMHKAQGKDEGDGRMPRIREATPEGPSTPHLSHSLHLMCVCQISKFGEDGATVKYKLHLLILPKLKLVSDKPWFHYQGLSSIIICASYHHLIIIIHDNYSERKLDCMVNYFCFALTLNPNSFPPRKAGTDHN